MQPLDPLAIYLGEIGMDQWYRRDNAGWRCVVIGDHLDDPADAVVVAIEFGRLCVGDGALIDAGRLISRWNRS
jgi:hypothetical protein